MFVFSVKVKLWRIMSIIVLIMVILGAILYLKSPVRGVFYPMDHISAMKGVPWNL